MHVKRKARKKKKVERLRRKNVFNRLTTYQPPKVSLRMDGVQKVLLSLLLGLLLVLLIFYIQNNSFKSNKSKSKTPTFLIIGSNNSGKTSLYYKLKSINEEELPTSTISSLDPNDGLIQLPFSNEAIQKPFRIVDFPGHLKYTTLLKKLILEDITLDNLKGIVFVIDSSSNSINQENKIKNITKLIFEILSQTEKLPNGIDFLFAVNKTDLFDSLPIHRIKTLLQTSMNEIIHNELNRSGTGGYDDDDEIESDKDDTVRQLWSIIVPKDQSFRFEMLEGNMEFKSGSVLKNKIEDWENWFDERVVNYGGM